MAGFEVIKCLKRFAYLLLFGGFTLAFLFMVLLPFSCLAYSYQKINIFGGKILKNYIPPLLMIICMTLILLIMCMVILGSV